MKKDFSDHQPGSITIALKRKISVGDTEKLSIAFYLVLVDFS